MALHQCIGLGQTWPRLALRLRLGVRHLAKRGAWHRLSNPKAWAPIRWAKEPGWRSMLAGERRRIAASRWQSRQLNQLPRSRPLRPTAVAWLAWADRRPEA